MSLENKIKEFLTNMATQDNRCTAFPIYYVIKSKIKRPCAEYEEADFTRVYYGGEEYDSIDDLKEYYSGGDDDDKEFLRKDILREAVEVKYKYGWEEKQMFLTETDAENHLRSNKHHYSDDAYTYVKHAWRASELTEFFNNLMKHFEIERKY